MRTTKGEYETIQIATCNNCNGLSIKDEQLNVFFCSSCPFARREEDVKAVQTIKKKELNRLKH